MLIGIAGKAGAGKDTLAGKIQDHDTKYYMAHLADPIKDMLSAGLGWDQSNWQRREWKELKQDWLGFSPREAAQKLGTEWRDAVDPTSMLWCKLLENRFVNFTRDVLIPDIRFPHEQDWVHSHGGIIVYVNREQILNVAEHSSEHSLDQWKVDLFLYNNSTPEVLYTAFIEGIEGMEFSL